MTDEHFDKAFEQLRTELNVTPSPEFAVKVRQQIEQAPARRAWNVWAWTGVAATCAVAFLAVAVWRSGPAETVDAPTPTLAAAPPIVVAQPSDAGVVPPDADRAVPSVVGRPLAPVVGRAFRPGVPSAPATVAAAHVTEIEILVPPDQLIAIRQLVAAVRTGVRVAPTPTVIDPETGELITPKPIEIPLITVTPLPGDPDGRSGGRENR